MENQAKQIMNQQILGDQSENPYTDLTNGQQPQNNQPQVNHQAAFEASLKGAPQNTQQPNQDNTYAFEQNGTYCRTGTLENGFIEADLQIFKEKGVESRFVSISVIGTLDEDQIDEIKKRKGLATLPMVIASEEQFNRFKEFISGLNWDD